MENREIKFEYGFESVNGIVKKEYHLHEIPSIKEKCDVWNMLPVKYVRQYIGLKANGKEIYEGDVLRLDVTFVDGHDFSDDETKDITHKGTFKVFFNPKVAAFDLELIESSTGTQGWCLMEDTKEEMEVIGNIYEHPELLTQLNKAEE